MWLVIAILDRTTSCVYPKPGCQQCIHKIKRVCQSLSYMLVKLGIIYTFLIFRDLYCWMMSSKFFSLELFDSSSFLWQNQCCHDEKIYFHGFIHFLDPGTFTMNTVFHALDLHYDQWPSLGPTFVHHSDWDTYDICWLLYFFFIWTVC